MTVICFLMREDAIIGFDMKGHSGAGKKGSDIVCAAVSSAAYMTVNTITDVLAVKAKVEVADGKMKLMINSGDEEKCAAILRGFMLHMKQLAKQKPHNIKILTVNSGKEHYYA